MFTQDASLQLDKNGSAVITAAAINNGSTDNCAIASVVLSKTAFDCTNVGINTVTLTVTDANGNSTSKDATVTISDIIAPKAIAKNITVKLNASGSATITPEDVNDGSFDNCSFTLSLSVSTFDCTNIGLPNTVTLTVRDASGNTNTTTAVVTVLENFKETLDLRTLSAFEAFTGTGAITNAGTLTGDVGTGAGALTGTFNGSTHLNDALTEQAKIDLLKLYIHLNNIFVTHPGTHAPAFGSGETITPGVYAIGGAGSVAGTLTLDGLGDPDAVFILKFQGAFTAGAGSNIVLTNGARAANVFWLAQGALSVGASSAIKGTLFAYPGAVTLGANSSIEGRLLSSVGAITVAADGIANMPAGDMNIPIQPMSSYTPAPAVDVLASVEKFRLFTSAGAVANAATSGFIGDIGTNVGAISGFGTSTHIGSFYSADAVTAQAKIDLDIAYNKLMLIPTTVTTHTPAFGSGETLYAGVYATGGAGSLAGTITLDGQGNPDAVFIFKFNGAFAAGAQSKVILSNGTRRSNVFWISEGATSIGAFSMMKGTLLAHNGACTMGAGGNLEGRMLSTAGAIGFSTGVAYAVVHDNECVYNNSNIVVNSSNPITVKTDVIKLMMIEEPLKLIAYPNPFTLNTTVSFTIPYQEANARLDIYDLKGTKIQNLFNGNANAQQTYEVRFDGQNIAAGTYFFRLITAKETKNFKVIMDK